MIKPKYVFNKLRDKKMLKIGKTIIIGGIICVDNKNNRKSFTHVLNLANA